MTEKKATRTYRVLVPIPPSGTEFEEGDQRLRFVALGDFEGAGPDEAVEAAATDAGDEWRGGPVIAVPLSHWQQREAFAKTMRIWEITKTPALPAGESPPPEET